MKYSGFYKTLNDSEIRLALCLEELAEYNPSYSLTIESLAKEARIAQDDVLPTLNKFETLGFIERTKTFIKTVGEQACTLRFTAKTDKQLGELQEEVRLLKQTLTDMETIEHDNFADRVGPNYGRVVNLAVDILGRGLRSEEIFFLGGLVHAYSSQRVYTMLQKQKSAKNPLRAVYVLLTKGASGGKTTVEDHTDDVVYRELE